MQNRLTAQIAQTTGLSAHLGAPDGAPAPRLAEATQINRQDADLRGRTVRVSGWLALACRLSERHAAAGARS